MKEVRLTQNTLRLWYYRHKDSPYFSLSIISLVISVCIILFFQIVVPQLASWFSIREETLRTRERVENINKNIAFMGAMDKALLNNQVTIATGALPVEKNFGEIVAALSDSSVKAGIVLEDFTFQVGNVASAEGKLNLFGQKDLSIVKITVSLNGSFEGVNLFLKEIQAKLPLSEIVEVDGDTFSTTVTLQFYQKQFPVIVYKDDVPILPVSPANLALLENLDGWRPPVFEEEEVGTESAGSVPLF